MNKTSNHHSGPLKGIFELQVEYGCSYNALDSRDGVSKYCQRMEEENKVLRPWMKLLGTKGHEQSHKLQNMPHIGDHCP